MIVQNTPEKYGLIWQLHLYRLWNQMWLKKKRYMIQNTYIAEQYLILKCKRVGTEGSNPAFEFLSI